MSGFVKHDVLRRPPLIRSRWNSNYTNAADLYEPDRNSQHARDRVGMRLCAHRL